MANLMTLARPYAAAIFRLAVETAELESWSVFLERLAAVIAALASELLDPRIGQVRLAALLAEAMPSSTPTQQRFLSVLAEKRRLGLVADVARRYEELRASLESRIDVEVVTAYPLPASEQSAFVARLSKRFNKAISLHNTVDPSVIGGAIVRAGDQLLDYSVRGRLAQLERDLVAV